MKTEKYILYFFLVCNLLFLQCGKEPSIKTYTLDLSISPEGSGTISPPNGEYEEGTVINIRVTPNSGFQFNDWSDLNLGGNPLAFTMNRNLRMTAFMGPLDTDGDRIPDSIDQCPNSNPDETIDSNGCGPSQLDADGDGVYNALDQCPGTPSGTNVNPQGCAVSAPDVDGDGVPDSQDQDNETREGVEVDENGVMINPIFLDENGITIKAYEWAIIGDTSEINGTNYIVVSEQELRAKIGNNENLTNVCTSKVTNMEDLFLDKTGFNQNIISWDMSNVTSTDRMFAGARSFNQNISHWDMSSVTTMEGMFQYAEQFNQPIGIWNTSSVTRMGALFYGAIQFNQPIGNWDVSNVCCFGSMFYGATSFNQDIGNWNMTSAVNVSQMFYGATSFNQPIAEWNVDNITNAEFMFKGASNFNQNLSSWCLRGITEFNNDFFVGSSLVTSNLPTYGPNCENPQVSADEDNDGILDSEDQCNNTPLGENVNEQGCSLSQLDSDEDGVNDSVDECNSTPSGEEVNAQGCSNSEKLYLDENGVTVKCRGCNVNGEILELNGERYVSFTNNYDFIRYYREHNSTSLKMVTTNLRNMENFFVRAGKYNSAIEISHWDTSNVITMENIFSSYLGPYNNGDYYAIIDADISNWDTSNVTNMERAFYNTIFTGDISNWDVSSVENMREMFAVDFVVRNTRAWRIFKTSFQRKFI